MNKIFNYIKLVILTLLPEKYLVIRRYKKEFGVMPNLRKPSLFTEKIQWLKLYDKNSLKTQCTDKLSVREYIKDKVGEKYLIPLVYHTDNVNEICTGNLPDFPVIVKPNHDSGGGFVLMDNINNDFVSLRLEMTKRLLRNYYHYSGEWEYKDIAPCLVIEKFLTDEKGGLLNDYKIHCFNGKPMFIQTIFDRESGAIETWFNTNWEKQEFYYFSSKNSNISKPDNLEEMLDVARKLAEEFLYVRVDLYSFENKVYFGELTFHPYCGVMKWQPQEMDLELGKLLSLEC